MKKIIALILFIFVSAASYAGTGIAEADSIARNANAKYELGNLRYYISGNKLAVFLDNPTEEDKHPKLLYFIITKNRQNLSYKVQDSDVHHDFLFDQMEAVEGKNIFYIIKHLPDDYKSIYRIEAGKYLHGNFVSQGKFYLTDNIKESNFYQGMFSALKYIFYAFCLSVLIWNFTAKDKNIWSRFTDTLLALPLTAMFLPDQYLGFSMVLLGIFATVNLAVKRRAQIKNYPWYLWLFPLVYAIRVIWLLRTPDLDYGLKSLETELSYLAIPLIFAVLPVKKENIIGWMKSYMAIALCYAVVCLICYFYQYLFLGADISNLKFASLNLFFWDGVGERHQSFMAVWMLMATAFSLYICKVQKNRTNLISAVCCCVFGITFAMLTGSRVALVIIPVLIALSGFFFTVKIKIVKLGIPAAIVLTAAFIAIVPASIGYFSDRNRNQIYATAVEAIKEKPFLGHGTNSQKDIFQNSELTKKSGFENNLGFTSMHNQFLDETVQFGFAGAVALFLILVMILFDAVKKHNFPMLAVFASWGLYMITDSPMVRANGLILIMMCFFLFSNGKLKKQNKLKQ